MRALGERFVALVEERVGADVDARAEKGASALRRHLAGKVSRKLRVLIEREHARCEDFTEVKLARPCEAGIIAEVVAAGHDGRRLIAA
jgi:hypothetical protein